jgi:cytochrome oxidase Cu insertion factor (SCO1/SenC/PrrC family)
VINTFYRKWIILGILFLLPVIFLLFLYPSTHNYNTLDIVNEDIKELEILNFIDQNETTLEENITILNFLGNKPLENITGAMNLKELVYDKFKGFKKFQIVTIGSVDSENSLKNVKKELIKSDELKYWFFATASDEKIKEIYNSLRSVNKLDSSSYTSQVFVVDKQRNQRGRIDDRNDKEIEKNTNLVGLYSYNSVIVSEIKKKMNDDIRILFTEYRQKRKGNFNSNIRRISNLDGNDE